jgi:hypothetical protein
MPAMSKEAKSSSSSRICGDCVEDTFLRAKIQKRAKETNCSFCGCLEKTIPLKTLATLVGEALQTHYTVADEDPDETDLTGENSAATDPSGTPIAEVIACMAGIQMDAAEKIRTILELRFKSKSRFNSWCGTPFSPGVRYIQQAFGSYEFDFIWNNFKKDIKEKSRFFNESAADALRSVFGINKRNRPAKQALTTVIARPGSELGSYYRARVFKSLKEVEEALKTTENELGPPLTEKAAAGRMNALGIPVFYGAFDPRTALAEVRPPVGSWVLLGRFDVQREISLLDLDKMEALRPRGSVFDPSFADLSERSRFLTRFVEEITRPVQPGDEAFLYLPTQAVADFLANLEDTSLDGILFNSVQKPGGRNVVLFNKSSRVHIPLEHELDKRRVQLWRDRIGKQSKDAVMIIEESTNMRGSLESGADHDSRPITLALDKDSIEVHRVNEVEVCTCTEKVIWLKR